MLLTIAISYNAGKNDIDWHVVNCSVGWMRHDECLEMEMGFQIFSTFDFLLSS